MTFNADKYERTITLHCPTCAGTQFTVEAGNPMHTCVNCGRTISEDDLQRESNEHIQAEVDQVKAEIAKDIKEHLADAFRGNKFIKIK